MVLTRRNRQLVRAFALIRALRNGRQTVDQLAAVLHVSSRTVRRDLDALFEANVPVEHDGETAAVYWLPRDWSL